MRSADPKARTASHEVESENSNTEPPRSNTGRSGQLKYKDRILRFICNLRPLGYDSRVIWITIAVLNCTYAYGDASLCSVFCLYRKVHAERTGGRVTYSAVELQCSHFEGEKSSQMTFDATG